jgi:hypothetical protein
MARTLRSRDAAGWRRLALWAAVALLALGAKARRARAEVSTEPYLSLSADGHYDDYIPGGGQGLVTRLAPAAGGRLHTHRLLVRVDGIFAYDRYQDTFKPVPDTWNVMARAQLDYAATRRLQLSASDRFTDARDPREIDRIAVVTPPGVSIVDNSADARASYALSRSVSLEGSYGYHFTRFGDLPGPMGQPVPVPGGDEHDFGAVVATRLDPLDILRAGYRGQYFALGAGAQTHAPSLGWWRRLTHTLIFDGEGGPLFFVDGAAGGETAATWRARASVLHDTPHWRLMANFDRDLIGGTGAAGIIWAEFGAGLIRWRPVRWLDLVARGDYFATGLPPDRARLVDGYDLGGEITGRVGDWLEIAGYYSYREQFDHEMAGVLGFQRNLVGIRLTALVTPSPRIAQEVK